MSPGSRKQLTMKQCTECGTRFSIRVTTCRNEACGVKVDNKAAQKRAVTRERKLLQKVTFKKAWDSLMLAAQVMHNSKPNGARISIFAMKKGEKVDSVLTFGLGGGQRFVESLKLQERFSLAMGQEVLEERKAEKVAREAAQKAEKAAREQAEHPPNSPVARQSVTERGRYVGARERTEGIDGGGEGPMSLTSALAAVVDGMVELSDSEKSAMKLCLAKEKFDLQAAKETSAIEYKQLFSEVAYAHWSALVRYLNNLQ